MFLKPGLQVLLLTLLILVNGCIAQFIPEVGEDQNLLVVDGIITDQPGQNSVKLSVSSPLGGKSGARPLSSCNVTVSDDFGNSFKFTETDAGTYLPDASFCGSVGRSYTLNIHSGESRLKLSYQSLPVMMKSVPPIDSVYWEKQVLSVDSRGGPVSEGCQIYLNTHDPSNSCKYYRWEFTETWEFYIPYYVPNNHCWITENSDNIIIKNASSFSDDRIVRQPLNIVSNTTDRLKEKYSILVKQYSVSEQEYGYWEKLQNVIQHVGSLYDLTPASIPSNITCIENPGEKVLGYFSVSAVQTKRIFINEYFRGIFNAYSDCEHKAIPGNEVPPNLGTTVWIIIDRSDPPPGYKILTFLKGCYDCTVRGTNIKPPFWNESKK